MCKYLALVTIKTERILLRLGPMEKKLHQSENRKTVRHDERFYRSFLKIGF